MKNIFIGNSKNPLLYLVNALTFLIIVCVIFVATGFSLFALEINTKDYGDGNNNYCTDMDLLTADTFNVIGYTQRPEGIFRYCNYVRPSGGSTIWDTYAQYVSVPGSVSNSAYILDTSSIDSNSFFATGYGPNGSSKDLLFSKNSGTGNNSTVLTYWIIGNGDDIGTSASKISGSNETLVAGYSNSTNINHGSSTYGVTYTYSPAHVPPTGRTGKNIIVED